MRKNRRIKQCEIKIDLITKELQNLNVWRRKHSATHTFRILDLDHLTISGLSDE